MRADHTNVLSSSGPGRNSVRIKSNSAWGHGVYVWDIRHMPQGCGTWPAAWTTVESGWPAGGEIDIVEGVNDYGGQLRGSRKKIC
jgi:beta-glucanase (GH16 family)